MNVTSLCLPENIGRHFKTYESMFIKINPNCCECFHMSSPYITSDKIKSLIMRYSSPSPQFERLFNL
jgi:hypothetical protein